MAALLAIKCVDQNCRSAETYINILFFVIFEVPHGFLAVRAFLETYSRGMMVTEVEMCVKQAAQYRKRVAGPTSRRRARC